MITFSTQLHLPLNATDSYFTLPILTFFGINLSLTSCHYHPADLETVAEHQIARQEGSLVEVGSLLVGEGTGNLAAGHREEETANHLVVGTAHRLAGAEGRRLGMVESA